MVELADTGDLKSPLVKWVQVRVLLPTPLILYTYSLMENTSLQNLKFLVRVQVGMSQLEIQAPIVQWLEHLAYIQLIGVRVPVGVPCGCSLVVKLVFWEHESNVRFIPPAP